MQVTNLKLTNFRNYDLLNISFSKKKNIFFGENGSGKTNILEAISFLTPGRGLRSARLSDIRRITPCLVDCEYAPTEISNTSWAVSATVCNNDDEIDIGTAVEKSVRRRIDGWDRWP